ncbi:MAG: ATP-binding cassette domain-containing protein [Streptosporangiales bacterium]|nr:ATP-binding cassette domain-containing protein [Streptosporangiales bacterium]
MGGLESGAGGSRRPPGRAAGYATPTDEFSGSTESVWATGPSDPGNEFGHTSWEWVLGSHPDLATEASGLVKTFGKVRAVDGIDLSVRTGGVYGFLGPNGAGKTTAIRVLATLLPPDGGGARVLGHDIVREANAVRGRVSLTGQFASVDEDLTGMENLVLLGRLLGYPRTQAKKRAGELLDAFGLTDAAGRQVKTYSGGMRRRLDVAASIVVRPDLIFLDEPTTGLDPRSRNQVWDIVRALVSTGTTVLLTTQYLDEADQLADRIAVIDHGKIIAEGTSGELKASIGSGALHVRLLDPGQRGDAERLLAETLGVAVHLDSDPAALSARISDTERVAHALAQLSRSGVVVTHFALGQPSLDEVFLALTGHPAEADDDATEENAA